MTIQDFRNLQSQKQIIDAVTDFTVTEQPNHMGDQSTLTFDANPLFVSVLKEAIQTNKAALINQTKKIMTKRVEAERAAMVRELKEVLAVEEPIVLLAAKAVL
jgi:hypothetical protein